MEKINPEIVISDDGSSTLCHPIIGDMYHSTAGAVSESIHVYIKAGLDRISERKKEIKILEMGFGSGLNALLTIEKAKSENLKIDYNTIELYPIDSETIEKLGYDNFTSGDIYTLFLETHYSNWFEKVKLSENFSIQKINKSLTEINFDDFNLTDIDLVYFDAFSPDTQPELWSEEVFSTIYNRMQDDGILVTYSAKGIVKRALRAAGFNVKRIEGALGKHHMLLCTKIM